MQNASQNSSVWNVIEVDKNMNLSFKPLARDLL
jgi:hypothetical protein